MAVLDASLDRRDQAPFLHVGLTPVFKRVNIPTTATDNADDTVLLFKFPAVAFVKNVAGAVSLITGAHDSGTPVWVAQIGFGDIDGVVDIVLLTGVDESKNLESIVVAGQKAYIDVSNKYLILDTTTASSAGRAAADLTFGLEFAAGLREVFDDGVA